MTTEPLLCIAQPAVARPVTKAREITRITITETGKSDYSADEDPNVVEGCKAFKPGIHDIRMFFLKSYPVPIKLSAHDRYSPCYKWEDPFDFMYDWGDDPNC